MRKKLFISIFTIICVIALSIGAFALQNTNICSKIFKNDTKNITIYELEKAQDEHLELNLSQEEFDEYGKKLKETIILKEEGLPKEQANSATIDDLINKIKRDINYTEESINNDLTINDKVKNRNIQHLEDLKKLLASVEKKEKSYNDYYLEYENQRLEYVEDYKKLRN